MSLVTWQKIDVAAKDPYPVFLGASLEELGEYLHRHYRDIEHILVVSNPVIADIYWERLKQGLMNYRLNLLIVPAGENEKSLDRLSQLTTEALRCGADRKTLVIALGGGVIGDLTGFFASIFMRGVRFIQVPTTLLAQVDSSIGGKVAVNHPAGKNILGAFYPPLAVWTDFSTLETLEWDEVENGLAESIKHAIISDLALFEFFENEQQRIKQRDKTIWREMVTRSSAVKVKIVSEDEHEQGIRGLLNLGHSFGHALETQMNYSGITHGQGVSIGIVAAAHLAHAKGLMSRAEVERARRLLEVFGLPTTIKEQNPQTLLQHMQADKKNQGGRKILILPKGIGQAIVSRECTDQEILSAWQQVIA
ncbi:3-dehydroquinate synthase [Desulfosporosinus orientis DSM 765]|uniref:3-dehydroquinate synthase n=1 Tax=Desulfosporosinus orientis (strain ATCC 19365 / DSM 765 / NCIMB 8382 / VKM B-1628 / Singapore I) TaxID=768706 RepID=G7W834_DESOD|nr:3-dehydroquinate synthase [Desulfosporosinus orientis]AET66680.1 3-dehydroquinate synthase [Desulfosporosinus orientis DSM 765]